MLETVWGRGMRAAPPPAGVELVQHASGVSGARVETHRRPFWGFTESPVMPPR